MDIDEPDPAQAGEVRAEPLILLGALGHVASCKGCQRPLISLKKRRPVTPEAAGSSPVAPARFQWVSRFGTATFQLFGPADSNFCALSVLFVSP